MITRFADTAYFVALVSSSDHLHDQAVAFASDPDQAIVTTSAVVTEFANHLSRPPHRAVFLEMFAELQRLRSFRLVHVDKQRFEEGLNLYRERADKAWSLTDCISFVLMGQLGLREALTADHHFEQAGFSMLLRNST